MNPKLKTYWTDFKYYIHNITNKIYIKNEDNVSNINFLRQFLTTV